MFVTTTIIRIIKHSWHLCQGCQYLYRSYSGQCTYVYVAYIYSYVMLTYGNFRSAVLSCIPGFNIQFLRDEGLSQADLQQDTTIAGNVTIATSRVDWGPLLNQNDRYTK